MDNRSFKIRHQVDKENDHTKLSIRGDAGIRNISALREALTKTRISTTRVDILLQHPDNIDLAFVQVIHALVKMLTREGKTVKMKAELSEEFAGLLQHTGFGEMFLHE